MSSVKSLSPQQLAALVVAVSVCSLPLFFAISIWLLGIYALVVVWRIQIHRTVFTFPNNWIKAASIVLSLGFIKWHFTNLVSVEVFVALFLVSFYLKFIEVKSTDEATKMFLICFVCLASNFLFYQTMFMALYCLVALIIMLSAWQLLQSRSGSGLLSSLRSSVTICLQVIPIMLVMFMVMPRLGQLWSVPGPTETGRTGFSDEMSPGSLSELIESGSVAFRVDFDGEVPAPSERYWRGFVLDNFDGQRWSRDSDGFFSSGRPVRANTIHPDWGLNVNPPSRQYRYSILMEPHQQRALFSLKMPVRAESSHMPLGFTPSAELLAPFPVGARMQYSVVSEFDRHFQASGLTRAYRNKLLALPTSNPRAQAYAEQLRKSLANNPEYELAVTEKILALFNASFTYTLRPPKLSENTIDGFLFDSQRGFCEHFSSSFVFLMRAAGVPARVVVGYQGGEWNQNNRYLMVRQSDAHAWAEIWVEGIGWKRIDATAAVSPLRIERGLRDAVSADESGLVGGWSGDYKVLSWMNHKFDALNFSWQKFVLNYDDDSQQQFFRYFLGGAHAWRVALFLIGSIAALLFVYFAYQILPRRRKSTDPIDAVYLQHLRDLNKKGFTRLKHETPHQFAARVGAERSDIKKILGSMADQYCRGRYNNDGASAMRLNDLRRALKSELTKN